VVATAVLLAGCGGGGGGGSSSTSAATSPSAGAGGGKKQATPGVYVGRVQNTNDLIGLVTDGSRVTGAYLCVPNVVGQWVRPAPLRNGKAPLVARRGVALGSATFSGNTATGKAQAGGTNNYSAKLATGKAGIYRTTTGSANQPGSTETGWVVLPDGSTCGTTNSVTSGGGFKSQSAPSSPQNKVTDFTDPFPF
jgi:hypothetical protein